MSGAQLTLSPFEADEVELVNAELVSSAGAVTSAGTLSPSPPPVPPSLAERNLFAEAERIAGRGRRSTRTIAFRECNRRAGGAVRAEAHR